MQALSEYLIHKMQSRLEAFDPDIEVQNWAPLKLEYKLNSKEMRPCLLRENPQQNLTADDASELSDWGEARYPRLEGHCGSSTLRHGWSHSQGRVWNFVLGLAVFKHYLWSVRTLRVQVSQDPGVNALKPASAHWHWPKFVWTCEKRAVKHPHLPK